jgi:probable rRNA maturation factor
MPAPEPHVSFHRVPVSLDRVPIENFAETLKSRLARAIEFHCLVTTDADLRRMNARFLGNDYPTDVLSFPELGDVAISYRRARAQAAGFGHSVEDEIRILMLHGTLHLLGMDHETDGGRMARAEAHWRKKLGLPNSLIARARA